MVSLFYVELMGEDVVSEDQMSEMVDRHNGVSYPLMSRQQRNGQGDVDIDRHLKTDHDVRYLFV